ncbi:NO-inducible flavohemoprotein [Pseudoalteromonas sp. T1lg75]|uniref:NO-inducible flavohemoprotein n=1 Tax=Pseudoalteromonas sp. T1lg75 TaxID=2077102 RepID=UPI000CF60CC4|nr:NO-inducible flavohemoprotein [Pseudoalteromonas sp. T1lg75]
MLSIQDIKTVQSTIPLIEQAGTAVTDHFYTRMFSHNPELKDIFNLSNQHTGRQRVALFEAIVAYAKNLDNPAVLANAIERIANKHVSFNIKADDYNIVGHHLIETMRELLSHHFTQGVEQAWGKAYGILANIFISREEQLYSQRESSVGGWRGKRAFQLTEKTEESELVTSFTFKPVDCLPVMDYRPGQYVAIELQPDTSEHTEIRQYSLSTKANGQDYRISVKREENVKLGIVSNYLHNTLKVGDLVDLHAPTGDFFFIDKQRPVVLISAGVGITPMQAMLDTLAQNQYEHSVTYIHACENRAQHSFAEHTAHLCEQHGWHHYTWYNQEQGDSQRTFGGLIDFTQVELPLAEGDYYLCGPIAFMQFAKEKLLRLGVRDDRIHYEVFGPHATL